MEFTLREGKVIEYIKKINTLKEDYANLLREFKEKYTIYEVSVANGGDNGYAKPQLEEIEKKLIKIQNDFFTIKNEIQVNITEMSKEIKKKDAEIDIITKQNEELKKKIAAAQDRKQGSAGKIYDELILYNQHNLGNWLIIVLMLLLSFKVVKPYVSTIKVEEIKSKGEQALQVLK